MIITDRITIEDRQYVRTASDEGMMIRKDGTEEMYSEAVDTEEAGFTYTETDIPFEEDHEFKALFDRYGVEYED